MNKYLKIVTILVLISYTVPTCASLSKGDTTELSVVDASVMANLIIKGDLVHFVAQVQTDDEIKYSGILRTGTYVTITDESESISYTYQYNESKTESPYNNFFRLHLYFNTETLEEGDWDVIHHVELENGKSKNSMAVQFSVRENYEKILIINYTEDEFTTKDNIFVSGRITNPNGNPIPKVEVMMNNTAYIMENEGDTYSVDVGMMPSIVKSFTYKVYTGRKIDGDTDHIHQETFNITIREVDFPSDDSPPVTNDTTQLPDQINPDSRLHFEVSYSDKERDTPEKVEINIFNSSTGALLFDGSLTTEGGNYREGVNYSLIVDLSQLNITPGLWSYKIKYRYNGSDLTIATNNFYVLSKEFDHKPELTDLTSGKRIKKTDTVEFLLEWKDEDGDEPSEVWIEIYDEGKSLEKGMLSRSNEGAIYSVGINLSNLDITSNEKITYRYFYIYGEEYSFPSLSEQPFEIHLIEVAASDGGENPIVIVLIILITIVILLALFVFTFGKRDPY